MKALVGGEAFPPSLRDWFAATERYAKQLHEIEQALAQFDVRLEIDLLAVASMIAVMDGGDFMAMMEYSSRHDSAAVSTNFLVPDGAVKLPLKLP